MRHGDRYLGKDHLMATGGLLDDTGFNRIYWTYGNRWPGFYFMLMRRSRAICLFSISSTPLPQSGLSNGTFTVLCSSQRRPDICYSATRTRPVRSWSDWTPPSQSNGCPTH